MMIVLYSMYIYNTFDFANLADNTTKTVVYQIPADETKVDQAESRCGEHEDILKVSWKSNNSFYIKFNTNGSNYDVTSWVISLNTSSLFNDSAGEFDLQYNYSEILIYSYFTVNQTSTAVYSNVNFEIPANFSYHCTREQTLNESIIISKVQFEAFKLDNTGKFSAAQDCDSNITPDIVPIAVGISLIALIVVVLIAYVVGRRRQQARGYLNIM